MSWSEFMLTLGYETKTTFWEDFSIADHFGEAAIKDTYLRAFNEWKTNTVYVTELVLVLNHKIWQHHESHPSVATLYDTLWREADEWCVSHLRDSDLSYYLSTID